MAKPDPGRVVQGPRGENIFVRDGRAFLRERDGSVATISETDIGKAAELGETFASQGDVQARDRARSNADYRAEQGTVGSMKSAAESAGRAAIDTALTIPRAMGAETASAGSVLSAITGVDEAEQLRRAEAFGEPLLGGANVGSVLFDLASVAAGVGIGTKALRGAGLAQRLIGHGAIDATTGALAGGAYEGERAWRAGEDIDTDALLMAMGTGAVMNAGLGALGTGASEALSYGRRAVSGTLGGATERLPGMLRSGARVADMVDQPTLRIRAPTGAGTPGAGFGMLRKSRRVGGAMRWMADKLEERAKAGTVASREANAVAKMAEREAASAEKRVGRELSKAETGAARARAAEERATRAALQAEQQSASSLERIRRTAVAKDEREAFSSKKQVDQAFARYSEAAEKANAAAAGERAEVMALEAKLAEARTKISLSKPGKRDGYARTVRTLEDELGATKEKHFQRRKVFEVELDTRGSDLAKARERLRTVERAPPGQLAVKDAEARHSEVVANARGAHQQAKQKLFDADRSLERAMQEKQLLDTERLRSKVDALDQPIDAPPQTSGLGRVANTALAGGDMARRGMAALTAAYNAQDEQRRNIDRATIAAITPGGPEQWQPTSGAGDYANFPDQQFQRPGEDRRQAFINRTDELSRWMADPESMIETMAQGVTGLSMLGPQTTGQVLDRTMRAMTFLGQYAQMSRFPRNPWEPKETLGPLDDGAIDGFERVWNATVFPGTIVDEVATWNLSLETIAAAGSVHPDLLAEMAGRMTEAVLGGEFEPDLHQRGQLSLLTGIPDLSVRPDFQVAYGSYMEVALAAQAPAPTRGQPGRPSGSPTMSQQFRTLSEQTLNPGR
jgi:hypothetical protein